MTPEEREDLQDIHESVDRICRLVQAAEAETALPPEGAAQVAGIVAQTVRLVEDLLAEAEEEERAEQAEFLRGLLRDAMAADAKAKAVVARRP